MPGVAERLAPRPPRRGKLDVQLSDSGVKLPETGRSRPEIWPSNGLLPVLENRKMGRTVVYARCFRPALSISRANRAGYHDLEFNGLKS